jgi:hypothetical protein
MDKSNKNEKKAGEFTRLFLIHHHVVSGYPVKYPLSRMEFHLIKQSSTELTENPVKSNKLLKSVTSPERLLRIIAKLLFYQFSDSCGRNAVLR